ncbi:MAG: alpha/beta hydrolase-fold protein [Ferruginibacter sp.]
MKNLKKLSLFLGLIGCFNALVAQSTDAFEKKVFINGIDTIGYRILLPENYKPNKKYPFILVLHGIGERGSDNELQLIHGSKLFLADSNRKKFPAIVVFPQCPGNSFWSNVRFRQPTPENADRFEFVVDESPTAAMRALNTLFHHLLKTYKVNRQQIYIGGLSMGGMGTFEMVYRNPGVFAAAFPICGGANVQTAASMKDVNWWIFHGAKDDVVPSVLSQNMYEALLNNKQTVRFSLYPEANHNSWDNAFSEPNLLSWLFSVKNKAAQSK